MTGRETGCVRVPSAPGRAPRPGRAGSTAFVVVPAAHGRGPHRAPAEATGGLPLRLAAPRAGPGPGPRNALSHARPLPWATLGEARRPSVPAPRRPAPPAGQAASRGGLTCDPPRSHAPGTPSAAWAPALRPRPGGGPRRQPGPRAPFLLPPSSLWLSTPRHFSHVAAPQHLPLVRVAVARPAAPGKGADTARQSRTRKVI